MPPFRPVPAKLDFPAQEREVLRWWAERDILAKYLRRNETSPRRFAFLDGPITANNPMGIHHAWGRTYKDLFQRYKTMAGYRQRYQNGFDGQGLWVEVEVEKELGFKSKRDIEVYGIAPFVELCKARVRRFADVITQQSLRLGYWMRWDASYHTMADENNYMIWYFLKRCWERGLIYKGHDSMPWCPRCGTGISEHEIVTEGYREVTHPGLTVRLPLVDAPGRSLLVWTTTPWTLTSNVAAAVHPAQTYVRVRQDDEELYVMAARLEMLTGRYTVLETLPGHALVGWRYRGPFDDLPAQEGVEHRVIPWEDVSADEGTGIVHIAPGAGAEDFALGKQFALPVLAPLDEFGVFVEGFGEFTGRAVAEVAEPIEARLRQRGLLYRAEPYTHRYPVCWRCGTELVFRVVDEWFIAMEPIRAAVMDVARQVRWIPEFGLERELDWLRNMRDWMISKKRYWGLALPIYECQACGAFEVLGSREELRARAVEGWEVFDGHSPHRPWVDAVKIRCRACGAVVARIPDVGNPWLDAGIVPFSTLIDPATGDVSYLGDRRYWREWFPFDFITEAFPGQYRNWFYSLLVMSTVLEGRAPFRVCLGHALVRDEQGREMHKSWGNAIEFEEAADRIGADVVRWVFASQNPAVNTNFGYGPADEVRRRFVLPLWNVYAFFVTYAALERDLDLAGLQAAPPPLRLLDRWILSRLAGLVQTMVARLDDYEPAGACRAVEAFVDDLSTWYVRRSRRRFWKSEDDQDKRAAYCTLYTVLATLTQALAPFMPFLSEAIYQNLVRTVDPQAPESVHLCAYPAPAPDRRDPALEALMDDVRELVRLGRAARGAARIRVRQPLPAVLIATTQRAILQEPELVELLADELNVKQVRVLEEVAPYVTYEVKPRFDRLGPRFGARVQAVAGALRALAPAVAAAAVQRGEGLVVTVDGERLELAPEELEVRLRTAPGYTAEGTGAHLVVLETAIDESLAREGWARELVHHIQQMRKDQGLEVSDRIVLYVDGDAELQAVLQAHRAYVLGETLSVDVRPGAAGRPGAREVRLDGIVATVAVTRP
ncbi:MAG: isoleucine--tRNA ligase [Armatimonadota bacterium]|nr:isoleucine--tRNA ligase [Armatimonadota bacterium]MDR7534509.1 isoleucine--tRNA ligase [Armatimonadota bacterium]MDR7536033.1 isoleucine--tRNA ligase [Armatimonadota bacterium]